MTSIDKSPVLTLFTGAFAVAVAIAAPTFCFAMEIPGASDRSLYVTVSPSIAVLSSHFAGSSPGRPDVVLVALNVSQEQLDDLASLGRSLEKKDGLAGELRRRQSRDAGQFGFDVGMGAAKGQTLPGPGKDRIGDALNYGERVGFDVAVKYSLERNNNLARAKLGAAIARQDPDVQEARTADRDVFYWLGFDIATAIYGDPALGAQGNTATGPNAFKIRDALSPAGQNGFNDSVAFHLARSYY